MAIRNPKAHSLIEQKDVDRTSEWLAFVDLFRVMGGAKSMIKNIKIFPTRT